MGSSGVLRVPSHTTSRPTGGLGSPPGSPDIILGSAKKTKLHGEILPLLDLGFGQTLCVSTGLMSLEVYLIPKDRSQDIVGTASFLAKIMVLLKVRTQEVNVRIEVLPSVILTEMTPKVLLSQVHVECFIVQITLVTELAVRVSFVRSVINITIPTVSSKPGSRVGLELRRKQLEVFHTDVTEMEIVCLDHVLTQLSETLHGRDERAKSASIRHNHTKVIEEFSGLKEQAIPLVRQSPIPLLISNVLVWFQLQNDNNL